MNNKRGCQEKLEKRTRVTMVLILAILASNSFLYAQSLSESQMEIYLLHGQGQGDTPGSARKDALDDLCMAVGHMTQVESLEESSVKSIHSEDGQLIHAETVNFDTRKLIRSERCAYPGFLDFKNLGKLVVFKCSRKFGLEHHCRATMDIRKFREFMAGRITRIDIDVDEIDTKEMLYRQSINLIHNRLFIPADPVSGLEPPCRLEVVAKEKLELHGYGHTATVDINVQWTMKCRTGHYTATLWTFRKKSSLGLHAEQTAHKALVNKLDQELEKENAR